MENPSSDAVSPGAGPEVAKSEARDIKKDMRKDDIPPLTLLLVTKLSRSLGLAFEVTMLSVLVTFSTYMRAKTIDGYYFTQKATLWGLVLHRATSTKVSISRDTDLYLRCSACCRSHSTGNDTCNAGGSIKSCETCF